MTPKPQNSQQTKPSIISRREIVEKKDKTADTYILNDHKGGGIISKDTTLTEKKIDIAIRKLTHYEKLLAEKEKEIEFLKEEVKQWKDNSNFRMEQVLNIKQKLLAEMEKITQHGDYQLEDGEWIYGDIIPKDELRLAIENMFEREEEVKNG